LLVIGRNGEGKSNLLEAVELLGSLRSHRCSSDRDLIRQGERVALISAVCEGGDQLELELRRQGGRQARRNGKLLERQHELIGPLRCVGFSALDLELVRGEPALRRQWLDRVVLQLEPVYTELLSRYGRLLRQRSQLLRRGLGAGMQPELLEAFDQQMALIGTRLHRRRLRALRRLEPLAAAWPERLSGGREQLQLLDVEELRLGDVWRRTAQQRRRCEDRDERRWSRCLLVSTRCARGDVRAGAGKDRGHDRCLLACFFVFGSSGISGLCGDEVRVCEMCVEGPERESIQINRVVHHTFTS
jgi:DNA replication and repair protein RecF